MKGEKKKKALKFKNTVTALGTQKQVDDLH